MKRATDSKEKAENLVADFKTWIAQHQDEITALQIFYSQPVRRRELNYKMIQEVRKNSRFIGYMKIVIRIKFSNNN